MQDIAIKYMNELRKQSKNQPFHDNTHKPQQSKNPQKHTFKYHKHQKNFFGNITDILFKDPDKSLILILIVLLMDNEENFNLILVLLYLLL